MFGKLITPRREIILDADAGLQTSRRSFLKGVGAAGLILAAPSVVRASSLMNVRGEPLRMVDFIPCDGRMLNDIIDKDVLHAIGGADTGRVWDDEGVPHDVRRYGGSEAAGEFGVPDFTPFDGALAPNSRYEIDRAGNLYVLADAKPADFGELSIAFGREGAADLIAGKRVKI